MVSRIIFYGDVVGKPGRRAVRDSVQDFKTGHDTDIVVVNAENAAGGSGLTSKIALGLFAAGTDVITTGDHFFRHREYVGLVDNPKVLRPANFPEKAQGFGFGVYDLPDNRGKFAVINLVGRIFMDAVRCPFLIVDRIVDELHASDVRNIIVDMHAEATSEKIAMGWHLDGRVTAVIGTHTHVQTNDAELLPDGAAYLTDTGMCGPHKGIIGREIEPVMHKLTTYMPARFDVAKFDVRANGCIVAFDETTGKALSIETFTRRLPDPEPIDND